MDKEEYANRVDELWNQLSLHMSKKFNTKNNTNLHYGIRENDFPNDKDSIVEFINNKIDLDYKKSGDFLRIYLDTKQDLPHWNESLKELIDYYYKIFYEDGIGTEDLKEADAAFSFNQGVSWVKPSDNYIGSIYDEVRNSDEILKVLKDNKHLQFTMDKVDLKYYLRLIMPEYKRTVEIEDLNRNFWVIGQALTALYIYIFNEDSPLPQLLSGILDEIVQLWENMFYLWLTTSMLTEKQWYKDIKFFIYPIPAKEIDNFSLNLSQTELLQKIWAAAGNQIIDKYSGIAIVVMPEIKFNNYAKNYYATSIYPGLIIYDNSQFNPDYWLSILPFEKALIIDLKEKEIKLENLGDDEE